MVDFRDKFIGFVDVLGFEKMVEASESGSGQPLPRLLTILAKLTPRKRDFFDKYGPKICPQSAFNDRNLDFRATQISDCLVVSSEVSAAGVINLVGYCWEVVLGLLVDGVMCRGYLTRGRIFHTDQQFIGTGYQEAYRRERSVSVFGRGTGDVGTPFVEIAAPVLDYVKSSTDECVLDMFDRFVARDGDAAAIFPFKRLSHGFTIGPGFDPRQERKSNDNLRRSIQKLLTNVEALANESDERARTKVAYYVNALRKQLEGCDKTDEWIDRIGGAFSR